MAVTGALTRAALAALVLVQGVVAGGRAIAADEVYSIERTVLQERRKDQVRPRIWQNWVIWKDYRGHSLRAVDESPNADVFAFDLESGQEYEIGDTDQATDVAIDQHVAVWTVADGRETDIAGYDFASGDHFKVVRERGRQERPAISNRLVVWQDNRNGNWDIFLRDLDGDDDAPVVEHRADQERPAISGRVVVWEDRRDRGNGPDIFGIDLETNRSFRLTTNHDAFEPAIDGRWVVWVGAVDQTVFARNLDDEQTIRLSSAAGGKLQPAIWGDFVVWTDERNGDRDIYGYDLVARTEFPIAVADGPQDGPSVYGSTVVWSDGRRDNRDIALGKVTWPRPVFPEPPPEPTAIPATATTAQPPAAPSTAPAATLVPLVVSGTDGVGVSLRASPSTSAAVLAALPEGAPVWAIGPARTAEGRSWRPVRDAQGMEGWVAAEFLAPAP